MNSAVQPSTGIAAPLIILDRELRIAALAGQITIFDRVRLLSAADCHKVQLSDGLSNRLVEWIQSRVESLPRAS